MRKRDYRKIYKEHFGEIPKDSLGRSYDIHHIDGNYNNNDISNLIAVSIEEHYKIHKEQGDWGAAWSVAKRLNISAEEKSNITRNMNLDRAKNGTHWSQVSSMNGTHHFQNSEYQKKLAQISISRGTHSSQQCWTCEICNKSGKHLVNYNRYHGKNCGSLSKSKNKIWINNGIISKMINGDDLISFLNEGWSKGRGSIDLTPRRLNSKGTTGRANPYIRKTSRPYIKKSK